MRAEVIIPRSPTMTRRSRPKRSRTTFTISTKEVGSAVLPGKTRIATGQPAGSVKSPYSIWGFPRLPSRRVAEGRQRAVPPLHPGGGEVEVRTPRRVVARPRGGAWRATPRWRPGAHRASPSPHRPRRSRPLQGRGPHQGWCRTTTRVVASLGLGLTTAAEQRVGDVALFAPGAQQLGQAERLACAATAARWPWGRERKSSRPSPATSSVFPDNPARSASISSGREMGEVRQRLVTDGLADPHRTTQQMGLVVPLDAVGPDIVATRRRDMHCTTTPGHATTLHRCHSRVNRLVATCLTPAVLPDQVKREITPVWRLNFGLTDRHKGSSAVVSGPRKAGVVSSRGESHPPALSEPYVTVSRHTAPTSRRSAKGSMCQWANSPADRRLTTFSHAQAFTGWCRNRLNLRMAHRTRCSSMRPRGVATGSDRRPRSS